MATETTVRVKASFLSAESFKRITKTSVLEVVFNEKTSRLSVLDRDNNKFYRCQAGIDMSKPMSFLIPEGDIENACLVNVSNASPLITKHAL